jgi:hypothetical protein
MTTTPVTNSVAAAAAGSATTELLPLATATKAQEITLGYDLGVQDVAMSQEDPALSSIPTPQVPVSTLPVTNKAATTTTTAAAVATSTTAPTPTTSDKRVFFAIPKCANLKGPAIFFHREDYELFMRAGEEGVSDPTEEALPQQPQPQPPYFENILMALQYIDHHHQQQQHKSHPAQLVTTLADTTRVPPPMTTTTTTTTAPDRQINELASNSPSKVPAATSHKHPPPSVPAGAATATTSKKRPLTAITTTTTSYKKKKASRAEETEPPLQEDWNKLWDSNFELLRHYKQVYTHCEVKREDDLHHPGLYRWTQHLRNEYKLFLQDPPSAPSLNTERIRLLNDLGFILVPAKKKKKNEGATKPSGKKMAAVPKKKETKPMEKKRRYKAIPQDRTLMLARDRAWEEKFDWLVQYKESQGDCKVTTRYASDTGLTSEQHSMLQRWCSTVRVEWKKYEKNPLSTPSLNQWRVDRLKALGFVRPPLKENKILGKGWEDKFQLLQKYKAAHGHCRMTPRYMPDDGNPPVLTEKEHALVYRWILRVRMEWEKYEMNPLSAPNLNPERVQRLRAIGFSRDRWEPFFDLLRQFRDRHGHCHVKPKCPPDGPLSQVDHDRLYRWIMETRKQWDNFEVDPTSASSSRGGLNAMRIERLRDIGFQRNVPKAVPNNTMTLTTTLTGKTTTTTGEVITSRNQRWEHNFNLLVEWKAKHGHFNIPSTLKGELSSFANWVRKVRTDCHAWQKDPEKARGINESRLQQLKDIGFDVIQANKRTCVLDKVSRLKDDEEKWALRVEQLKAYSKEHGDCNVSFRPRTPLRNWGKSSSSCSKDHLGNVRGKRRTKHVHPAAVSEKLLGPCSHSFRCSSILSLAHLFPLALVPPTFSFSPFQNTTPQLFDNVTNMRK